MPVPAAQSGYPLPALVYAANDKAVQGPWAVSDRNPGLIKKFSPEDEQSAHRDAKLSVGVPRNFEFR